MAFSHACLVSNLQHITHTDTHTHTHHAHILHPALAHILHLHLLEHAKVIEEEQPPPESYMCAIQLMKTLGGLNMLLSMR